MALALTIGAQAERIDSTQFVAFYNYTIQTQDDEGQNVTDRMQLAVQVGRTVVKSMPRSAYKEMDMDEKKRHHGSTSGGVHAHADGVDGLS